MSTVDQLRIAWEAVVAYRQQVHADSGVWRSHLVDLDLWGVLVELSDDGALLGSVEEVMGRVLAGGRQPVLPDPMTDPAQEIYDAIMFMLRGMGVVNEPEVWE